MTAHVIPDTRDWFVAAGQMTNPPAPSPKQSAFYLGMQLEELAEKLEAVLPATNLSDNQRGLNALRLHLRDRAVDLKRGDYNSLLAQALERNPKGMLDADMDLMWVTIGAAYAQGADVPGAYAAVNAANWAKFPGGVATRHQETGKVVKPEGWKPPDLAPFVHFSLGVDPE